MIEKVDVAIIGAGSAGLAALKEVQKKTDRYVVIDEGPLGSTCARVGCMPSKALIQVANEHFRRLHPRPWELLPGGKPQIDVPRALAHVRRLRDEFTQAVVRSTTKLGARLVRGRARLLGPAAIQVGDREFAAKRIVLAAGSRPIIAKEYSDLGARVVTTDTLFELEDLPRRVGVIGLGNVGLEMGQALSRLGCEVLAFDRSREIGDLTDPKVNSYAARHFSKEFALHLDVHVKLELRAGKVAMISKGRSFEVDMVLASSGRKPNLVGIGLETTGAALDERGVPKFDPATMRLPGLPIFIAGDVDAHRAVQHEAVDEGRIAGYNSVHAKPRRLERRVPLAITFSDPDLLYVGKRFKELKRGRFVAGEVSFETQGRARILGEKCGLLHVYADAKDGYFLGAEMIGPAGEHLAHLMAWALRRGLSVSEMLELPFYHPTLEEGLRTALQDAAKKLKG